MKKIMIAMAAAIVGVAANAASVSWQCTNVRIPEASNPLADQGNIQTGSSSAKFDADALSIDLLWLNGDTWTKITDANTTGSGVKAKAEFWDQDTAVANRDASGYAYFKIVAEYSTQQGVYSFAQESGSVDLGSIESAAKTVTFNMNNGLWNYTTNVPEPTSGLLLLLGMAGLALKRKQA